MVINRTVTLVLGEQGQVQIIVGGELTPAEGVTACRAAADWFQEQAVQAEVKRRVEEMRRNGDQAPTPASPASQGRGGGSVDPSEAPVVDG
jgi:hypothetical protein